ncbi:MAG: DNA-binding protein [Verrucomicrobiota bacterium]|jgi:predicted nucleic acid-binding protein
MRVFLDANILFSGAPLQSRMRAFLKVLFKHGGCITSAYAVEEARRNLEVKFPAALRHLDSLIGKCEWVPALVTDLKVELPLKDVPILGGAVAGGATHLLTGDQQDFGVYFGKTVQGVKIVSPKMLADELIHRGLL